MTVRTRFAPSPTGYMHIGQLRTALYTYLLARKNGGSFILRIEDTDQEREVPGAREHLYKSMRLAGLEYDEGPDVGGAFGPYIQSQRRHIYREYAEKLVETGGAYYCFCTKERLDSARADFEARGDTFKYDKHCLKLHKDEVSRRVAAGEPYVIRQNIPDNAVASFDDTIYGHIEVDTSTLDDNVLLKSDGLPTYNFANVVDDHLMGITHIMRGNEYLSSTPKYNLLYEAFGWEKPVYIHLPNIMRDATHKLSKRDGDPSYEDFLNLGYLSEAIINYVALLGWNPGTNQEFFTREELKEAFSLEGLSKSPAILDKAKLAWMNGEYIKKLPAEEFYSLALPWYERAKVGHLDCRLLSRLLQTRVNVFNEIPEKAAFLAELPDFSPELYTNAKQKCSADTARSVLPEVLAAFEQLGSWSEETVHGALFAVIEKLGLKTGQVMWPARIAVTGRESTPGGAVEMAVVLGKDECIKRLRQQIEKLKA